MSDDYPLVESSQVEPGDVVEIRALDGSWWYGAEVVANIRTAGVYNHLQMKHWDRRNVTPPLEAAEIHMVKQAADPAQVDAIIETYRRVLHLTLDKREAEHLWREGVRVRIDGEEPW